MRKIFTSLAIIFSATVLMPGLVRAQETPATDHPVTDAQTVDRATRRADRLQNYKDRLTDKLTAVEERRVKNACKAAQVITARLVSKVEQVRKARTGAYEKVIVKLTELTARLQAAGVDTSELDTAVAGLTTEIDSFMAAIDTYKTTVSDLSELDCEADPEAFNAALQSAKRQRVALISSSRALHKYVNDNIKPILTKIRASLSDAS